MLASSLLTRPEREEVPNATLLLHCCHTVISMLLFRLLIRLEREQVTLTLFLHCY
jgi:hypothetical protein